MLKMFCGLTREEERLFGRRELVWCPIIQMDFKEQERVTWPGFICRNI